MYPSCFTVPVAHVLIQLLTTTYVHETPTVRSFTKNLCHVASLVVVSINGSILRAAHELGFPFCRNYLFALIPWCLVPPPFKIALGSTFPVNILRVYHNTSCLYPMCTVCLACHFQAPTILLLGRGLLSHMLYGLAFYALDPSHCHCGFLWYNVAVPENL